MPDPIERLNAALEGRYRIERELGEGGMATVYLADDVRHGRKVAIKVLKPDLAAVVGGDRFLAEIATTANLQHPHILPLFDSGEADGFLFYVMPFVDGETLRDRLDREKQLPVDEAVRLAVAVAHATQAAHDHGVVHRDIKPANILLSRGQPLVADFGISLAVGVAGGSRLTETGLSVGTPYYMSPEQATGDQTLGPATDQYALGCVLYEMLTGDPPYVGSTAQAVLGKIIQGAPARPTEARKSIPANVDGAILQALEKLPADRFTSVDDFAAALSNPAYRYGEAAGGGALRARGGSRLTVALAATTAAFALLAGWGLFRPRAEAPTSRWYVEFPASQDFSGAGGRNRFAITRDGSRIVYVGPSEEGVTQLWLRDRDKLEARPLAGTDGASNPSLSPDETEVAYTAETDGGRELRAAPLNGGPTRLLADSLIDRGGVSWGYDGYVYFDAHLEGDGFARVQETGGTPEPVTHPAPEETWHSSPQALPNGRGVLFYAAGVDMIGVADLRAGTYKLLSSGVAATYSPSGHLLWVTPDGTMMAAPFDADALELTGRPVPLTEGVGYGDFGGWDAAISDEGTLLYVTGQEAEVRTDLVWADVDGNLTTYDEAWSNNFTWLSVSPDGRRLAVQISESPDEAHIWVRSVDGDTPARVTFEGFNGMPQWTPDGTRLLYLTRIESGANLMLRDPDVPGRGSVLVEDAGVYSLARDGRWMVFNRRDTLQALRMDPGLSPVGDPIPLDIPSNASAGSPFFGPAQISPDGRWLAYSVNPPEGGNPRVEVRPFPNVADGRWPISPGAGILPYWSPRGDALYYRSVADRAVMRVPVAAGSTFVPGTPEVMVPIGAGIRASWPMNVAPDGRLIMVDPRSMVLGDQRLVVVEGFFKELRERVGG